jgi:hypothetical protein
MLLKNKRVRLAIRIVLAALEVFYFPAVVLFNTLLTYEFIHFDELAPIEPWMYTQGDFGWHLFLDIQPGLLV